MPWALTQLARDKATAPVADAVRLHYYLALVPDPRGRRGRLYPLVPLLSAAAASMLAGARSLTAVGEWLAAAPSWVLRVLGFTPASLTGRIPVPHPGTRRRLLARLDGEALDAAIGGLRPIALDGKTVRGAYLRERGAHYIADVKANHPGLFDRVRRPPWREIALDHYERTCAHHRQEIRRLKTAAFAHIDYPDAKQALQVIG